MCKNILKIQNKANRWLIEVENSEMELVEAKGGRPPFMAVEV